MRDCVSSNRFSGFSSGLPGCSHSSARCLLRGRLSGLLCNSSDVDLRCRLSRGTFCSDLFSCGFFGNGSFLGSSLHGCRGLLGNWFGWGGFFSGSRLDCSSICCSSGFCGSLGSWSGWLSWSFLGGSYRFCCGTLSSRLNCCGLC